MTNTTTDNEVMKAAGNDKDSDNATLIKRRDFAQRWLALPALTSMITPLGVIAAGNPNISLACTPEATRTRRQTAGPFYTPNTPNKDDFRADDPDGAGFTLTGRVVDAQCQPQAEAVVDLWHCDSKGRYDNKGYHLRGHVFCDKDGRFVIHTITPGIYRGRTRHFHVTLGHNNKHKLTTQLYFPEEPENDGDSIFNPSLLMEVVDTSDGHIGRFQFII